MEIIRRAATAPKKRPDYIEPEEYDHKPITGRVAIFDTETDPFAEKRIVKPFTCGFYIVDTDEYYDFWGDDCIRQFFDFLAHNFPEDEFTIFVHNGGNFDFYFLTEYFDEGMKPFIINGRLVRITCRGHEFRDSYAMIPVALGNALTTEDGGKIEIDYAKFEREVREENKGEILIYQRQDCTALGKLVAEWLKLFGNRMTMASVALPMLRSYHGFDAVTEHVDETMRPFYFGGRCQAFEVGIIKGDFYGYDINSSYPDVMRRVKHPISDTPLYERRITERTHFARIRAWSNGALPIRKDDGGLAFPVGTHDFFACIHEIKAGLETGNLRINKVYESIYFEQETSFDTFIDTFYNLRLEAGANGDEIRKLFYKLVMNSSYGKFAQDPRKYESWVYDPPEIPTPLHCEKCYIADKGKLEKPNCEACKSGTHDAYGWYLHTQHENKFIYARPQRLRSGTGFFNVATAASITSAARASLLYAINACRRPIYVDTDSLICEAINPDNDERIILDSKRLGAWKEEFHATTVGIAGKKLYTIGTEDKAYAESLLKPGGELELMGDSYCIKKASKGVRLSGDDIYRICSGETIEYANPVPKFSMFKEEGKGVERVNDLVTAQFMTRRIRATGGNIEGLGDQSRKRVINA